MSASMKVKNTTITIIKRVGDSEVLHSLARKKSFSKQAVMLGLQEMT